MAKPIVSDGVPDCSLVPVGFDIEPLTLTVTGKDSILGTVSLRVFLPEFVDGTSRFIENICRILVALREQMGEGEHAFYQ